MAWDHNRSALADLNGQKGPADVKLKMGVSLREIAGGKMRASAPGEIEPRRPLAP
jgi:hypothetical protein